MSGAGAFFTDPRDLPGDSGGWLRGEHGTPPPGLWLPEPDPGPRLRRLTWVGGIGTLALLGLTPLAAGLELRVLLAGAAVAAVGTWSLRRRVPSPPPGTGPGTGRHGLLLQADGLVYRVGRTCAVLDRADVTGTERRRHPTHGVVGALTLRPQTGRGALPSPVPGAATAQALEAWWADGLRASAPAGA